MGVPPCEWSHNSSESLELTAAAAALRGLGVTSSQLLAVLHLPFPSISIPLCPSGQFYVAPFAFHI